MCKENKNCKCNGTCTGNCRCEKSEPLIIGFENDSTGEVERYEFIELFEFEGQEIMAVTLVGGNGFVEFVLIPDDENEPYGQFIDEPEVEDYFAKLHEDDEEYIYGYVLELIDDEGNMEEAFVVYQFEYEGATIYVEFVGENEEGDMLINFIRQDSDGKTWRIDDEAEAEKLLKIINNEE